MVTVGIRELKNRLSEYIRAAAAGENVLVTDRGEVVAELTGPGRIAASDGVPPGIAALARRGVLTPGTGQAGSSNLYRSLPRSRSRKVTGAEFLDQERGSR